MRGGNNNPRGINQYSKRPWLRVRFKTSSSDYRPLEWPPVGPYWCSGQGDDHLIVVAYVHKLSQVENYWPKAYDIEHMGTYEKIEYTERFSKPIWWKEKDSEILAQA